MIPVTKSAELPDPQTPGDLSLDFANTVTLSRGRRIDSLRTPEDLRGWMEATGLLERAGDDRAMLFPTVARIVLTEAHRLRAVVQQLFEAHSERAAPSPVTLHALNRVLDSSARTSFLETMDERLTLVEIERGDAAIVLLAPVALAAARLVLRVDPARLRECAAPECRTWFVDTSRGGRRRWCSMARCGNQTKAARHRRKQALRP